MLIHPVLGVAGGARLEPSLALSRIRFRPVSHVTQCETMPKGQFDDSRPAAPASRSELYKGHIGEDKTITTSNVGKGPKGNHHNNSRGHPFMRRSNSSSSSTTTTVASSAKVAAIKGAGSGCRGRPNGEQRSKSCRQRLLSVGLEPLPEEETALKGHHKAIVDKTAVNVIEDSERLSLDSGFVEIYERCCAGRPGMDGEDDENANKAANIIKTVNTRSWSRSSTPRTTSTSSAEETLTSRSTPSRPLAKNEIIKNCRPLFGLVKHHVCSRFQMLAEEEVANSHHPDDGPEVDPFSSLPPTMNSLCIPSPAFTSLAFDTQPTSMPCSPFRTASAAAARKSSICGLGGSFKARSERDLSDQQDEVIGAKKCRDGLNWHSRVWLRTSHDVEQCEAPEETKKMQLCHVCKPRQCNYRNDISKHFASRRRTHQGQVRLGTSNSSALIWYRYFAR